MSLKPTIKSKKSSNKESVTFWIALGGLLLSITNSGVSIYDEFFIKKSEDIRSMYQSFEAARNLVLTLIARSETINSGDQQNQMELHDISDQIQSNDDIILALAPKLRDEMTYTDATTVEELHRSLGNWPLALSFNALAFQVAPSNRQRFEAKWRRADIKWFSGQDQTAVLKEFEAAETFQDNKLTPAFVPFLVDWLDFDLQTSNCVGAKRKLQTIYRIETNYPPNPAEQQNLQREINGGYTSQRQCTDNLPQPAFQIRPQTGQRMNLQPSATPPAATEFPAPNK
jgi:hypothetical protein